MCVHSSQMTTRKRDSQGSCSRGLKNVWTEFMTPEIQAESSQSNCRSSDSKNAGTTFMTPEIEAEGSQSNSGASTSKIEFRWSATLHEQFVSAVTKLGGEQSAKPRDVQRLMKVPDLGLRTIRRHLEEYRSNGMWHPVGSRMWTSAMKNREEEISKSLARMEDDLEDLTMIFEGLQIFLVLIGIDKPDIYYRPPWWEEWVNGPYTLHQLKDEIIRLSQPTLTLAFQMARVSLRELALYQSHRKIPIDEGPGSGQGLLPEGEFSIETIQNRAMKRNKLLIKVTFDWQYDLDKARVKAEQQELKLARITQEYELAKAIVDEVKSRAPQKENKPLLDALERELERFSEEVSLVEGDL